MEKNMNSENLSVSANDKYEMDYIEIRPLILSVMKNEELLEIEKSKEFRTPLMQALRRFKLLSLNANSKNYQLKITDIIKYSALYKNAADDEKCLALYFEILKYVPGNFIDDYYSWENESSSNNLQLRDIVCKKIGLKNILVLEKYDQFQLLCLSISENRLDRLADLTTLVEKFGDKAKYLFIREIFYVKDPILTKELINNVPDMFGSKDIEKIKLKAYYQGKLTEEALDYIMANNSYKYIKHIKNADIINNMLANAKNNAVNHIDVEENKINVNIRFAKFLKQTLGKITKKTS